MYVTGERKLRSDRWKWSGCIYPIIKHEYDEEVQTLKSLWMITYTAWKFYYQDEIFFYYQNFPIIISTLNIENLYEC